MEICNVMIDGVMKTVLVDAIIDHQEVVEIARDMRENGWCGPQVLLLDRKQDFVAITGASRTVAAEITGTDLDAHIIDLGVMEDTEEGWDLVKLASAVVEGDGQEKLDALIDLANRGLVDGEAVEIMRAAM